MFIVIGLSVENLKTDGGKAQVIAIAGRFISGRGRKKESHANVQGSLMLSGDWTLLRPAGLDVMLMVAD